MYIETTAALKEWTVTIEALGAGLQTFILRKGGIREQTKDFKLFNDTFFMFPSFWHQDDKFLKDEYKTKFILDNSEPEKFKVKYFAKVVKEIKLESAEFLSQLDPLHIWTETFVQNRYQWKNTKPLHLLILRVFKLEQEIELDYSSEYSGCKSWICLPEDLVHLSGSPVLNDNEFAKLEYEISAIFNKQ